MVRPPYARRRRQHIKRDRSVGIVLYRDAPEGRKYLVLCKRRSTDFAKGHVEAGESDEQAAVRETLEETGITDVTLHSGYLGETAYTLRKGAQITRKTVAFFLGRTTQEAVTLSHEHQSFAWLSPDGAVRRLSFENQRNLIREAERRLAQE